MQKIFTFALFLQVILQGVSSTNLALNRPAYQSTTWSPASEAVDGVSDTNHVSSPCTHTDRDTNAWWAVDLGDVYHVTSVTITNRGDCCASRLGDFNIGLMSCPPTEVAPEPTGVYDTIYHHPGPMGSGQTANFPSSDESLSGRYLVIQLLKAGEHLTLCEVEVFGYAADNLALLKPAIQITWNEEPTQRPENAVDGDATTNHAVHPCSHTSSEENPWLAVDLGDDYRILFVSITNRADCCSERLHDFNVGLAPCSPWDKAPAPGNYDVLTHEVGPVGSGATVTYSYDSCPQPTGRYLVIQIIAASEILTICEVTVSGIPGASTLVCPTSTTTTSTTTTMPTTTTTPEPTTTTIETTTTTPEPTTTTIQTTTTTQTATPTPPTTTTPAETTATATTTTTGSTTDTTNAPSATTTTSSKPTTTTTTVQTTARVTAPATTPTSPTFTTKKGSTTKPSDGDTYNINITAVAGPLYAAIVLGMIIGGLLLYFFLRRRNNHKNKIGDQDETRKPETSTGPPLVST